MTKKTDQNYSFDDFLDSIGYDQSVEEDLAIEAIAQRISLALSQKDLAERMGTTQSVISRFENLGRTPSIPFLMRMAKALGQTFKATLLGDYMYVVPRKYHKHIDEDSLAMGKSTTDYLKTTFDSVLDKKYQPIEWRCVNTKQSASGAGILFNYPQRKSGVVEDAAAR